jgi:hypothetical protein
MVHAGCVEIIDIETINTFRTDSQHERAANEPRKELPRREACPKRGCMLLNPAGDRCGLNLPCSIAAVPASDDPRKLVKLFKWMIQDTDLQTTIADAKLPRAGMNAVCVIPGERTPLWRYAL